MEQKREGIPGYLHTLHSRRLFLTGTGAVALLALTTPASSLIARGATPGRLTQQDIRDVDILNFLLVLEQVNVGFGDEATGGNVLTDDTRPYFIAGGRNASERAAAFTARILEEDPSYEVAEAQESYNFGDTRSEAALLRTAVRLGSISTGGYANFPRLYKSKSNLTLTSTAMNSVARQLATFRYLNRQFPSPSAFAQVLTADQVRDELTPILGG